MTRAIDAGRWFVALALIAFGVQHAVHGKFVTRLITGLPSWIPGHMYLAWLVGGVLALAGIAVLRRRESRAALLLLGYAILLSGLLLWLPRVLDNVRNGALWTSTGKAFALGGCILIVAATHRKRGPEAVLGRYLLASFLILAGIQHFLYVGFVVGIVPAWVPEPRFWAYFTGVALIAGGLGMTAKKTLRPAAGLSALMIFTWVLCLHIPRAWAARYDANETTAVFEALAMSGAALLVWAGAGTKRAR